MLQILLAEDEPEIRELVTMGLKLNAMMVESVANGQLAVEAARKTDFDLIMLDMNMPFMGGIEAAQEIRTLPQYEQTPILFLSGDDEAPESQFEHSYSLGKPFTIRELATCVRNLTSISAETS